ncbi:MAG: hypothetical protein JJT82_07860 [Legionellaceae bacterium]|nr:hypothetical protein [Legionellaceae bacterium]
MNPTQHSQLSVVLSEGLPEPLIGPLNLDCTYSITPEEDYFLLRIHLSGLLHFTCQRCAGELTQQMTFDSCLAVCPDDTIAERLMSCYEPIVVQGRFLDLTRVVLDDLHLASVYVHPDDHCPSITS